MVSALKRQILEGEIGTKQPKLISASLQIRRVREKHLAGTSAAIAQSNHPYTFERGYCSEVCMFPEADSLGLRPHLCH